MSWTPMAWICCPTHHRGACATANEDLGGKVMPLSKRSMEMRKSMLVLPLLISFLLLPLSVFAQQGPAGSAPETKAKTQETTTKSTPRHHKGMTRAQMAAQCEKWKSDFKAMDDRLNEKLAAMNSAQGDEKVTAMAGVVNELVTQRKEMRDMMARIHHTGMGRMCAMMGNHKGMHGGMGPRMHHEGAGTESKAGSSS